MANLQAELARFEAELAGTSGQPVLQAPLASLPPPPPLRPGIRPPGPPALPSMPPQMAPTYAAAPQAAMPQSYAYAEQPAVAYPTHTYSSAPQQQPAPQAPYNPPAAPYNPPAYNPPAAPSLAPRTAQYVTVAAPAPYYPPAAAAAAAASAAPAHSAHDLASVKAALEQEAKDSAGKGKKKPPAVPRAAGGSKWWDASLMEWPENDFRIFVGDLGNEVNDDVLTRSFQKYDTFAKAKVVKDNRTKKSKGYGFVSFTDPIEGAKALREMDGKYVGNRPCKLRKSNWEERTNEQALGKKRKGLVNGKPVLNLKKHVGVLHR